MSLGFNKELFDEIVDRFDQGEQKEGLEMLELLHPADAAEVITQLKNTDVPQVFDALDDEFCAEILTELEEDFRIGLLVTLSPAQIYQKFLRLMDSDDAADLVNDLPAEQRLSVTEYLKNTIKSDADDIISLIKYVEDTAGSLMATELVRVNINWTVSRCVEEIRREADEVDTVYAVYVVDDEGHLKGLVPLSQLIISRSTAIIKDFYDPNVISISDMSSATEAADIMNKYDLVALPVLNYLNQLVGRITIDDVVDYIKEEAEEDYQLASGLSENVEYSDTVWVLSRARLPWLFLGLLGGIASSKVIGLYEEDIQIYPQMALFIPLIAAMGGNAGVQSSAIVVQSLASKAMLNTGLWAKLSKEFLVSLINGVLCAGALSVYGLIDHHALALTITISTALLIVIVLAAVLGAFIPLVLNSLKVDPALATGPFITTTNDLLGLGIYFFIGRIMYDIFQTYPIGG